MGIDGITPQSPQEWADEVSVQLRRERNHALAQPPREPKPIPRRSKQPRHKPMAGWKILLWIVGGILFFAAGGLTLLAIAGVFWGIWRGMVAGSRVKRDPNGGSFWFFFWSG